VNKYQGFVKLTDELSLAQTWPANIEISTTNTIISDS